MKVITRPIKIQVALEGETVISEHGFTVEIRDYGSGEFVAVAGAAVLSDGERGVIEIDAAEWPTLRAVIDDMIKACKE